MIRNKTEIVETRAQRPSRGGKRQRKKLNLVRVYAFDLDPNLSQCKFYKITRHGFPPDENQSTSPIERL